MVKDLQKEREWKKNYRKLHREQLLEYNRKYHKAHREHERETRRDYYCAHQDQLREYGKTYYYAHLEHYKIRAKKYHTVHKDELNESFKRYRKKHTILYRLKGLRRYEKVDVAIDVLKSMARKLEDSCGKCYACDESLDWNANRSTETFIFPEISRIDPEHSHFLIGNSLNMTILCKICNRILGASHLADLGLIAFTYLTGDIIPPMEFKTKQKYLARLWKNNKARGKELGHDQRHKCIKAWKEQLEAAMKEFNYCFCDDSSCIFRPSLDSKFGRDHSPTNTEIIPFGLNCAKNQMPSTEFWPIVYRKLRAILVNYDIEFDEKDLCPLFKKHLGMM